MERREKEGRGKEGTEREGSELLPKSLAIAAIGP